MSDLSIDTRDSVRPRGVGQLEYLIEVLPGLLSEISSEAAGVKPAPVAWSVKEELGHLIDSSANNQQRVVRAQLEDNLALAEYDGERWVEVNGYQNREWTELIALWKAGNSQLLAAARFASPETWSHTLTIGDSEPMTLAFVVDDYIRHMTHHLEHIGIKVGELVEQTEGRSQSIYPENPAPVDPTINELMRHRWSPRVFDKDRRVEREKILTMLEAARWSPSCFNDQPRYFLVFDESNEDALGRARDCLVDGNAWAREAPVLMLSVARDTFEKNGKPNRWAQHDTGLATENLLLEAVEIGLVAHAMAGYDADRARSEFGIPEGFTSIAMIAVGYPYRGKLEDLDEKRRAKELSPRLRKPIGEIAFAGSWGRSINRKE